MLIVEILFCGRMIALIVGGGRKMNDIREIAKRVTLIKTHVSSIETLKSQIEEIYRRCF